MKIGTLLLSAIILTGCVSTTSDTIFSGSKPIIDKKGVDLNAYEVDLKECTEYANDISVGRSVLKGSAAGAAIGGVVEVLTDDCLLYTSPSPRDLSTSRMPSSA